MKKASLRDLVRYHFDEMMSRGPIVSIGWLVIATVLFVAALAAVIYLTGIAPPHPDNSPLNPVEVIWISVLQILNANLLTGEFNNTPFLLAVLCATVGGLLIVGSLIGILTNGIQNRLERMRQGRSLVVETGHTVILGWSPNVFPIVAQLVIANAERKNQRVVILADEDKVEMEDKIHDRIPKTGPTRIVCRTGNPIDVHDLEIVNPRGARAIIILSPDADDPDSNVIKSILALTNHPDRRADRYHIVAEISDPRNMAVARMVGQDEVQLVLAGDLIAHIVVQTLRQTGLSLVYTELLDFEGDDIYFQAEPGLTGKTFGDALFAYNDSALIGMRFKDGHVDLNPPMDTRIEPGDEVIAISRDYDTVKLSTAKDYGIDSTAIRAGSPTVSPAKRTLILGWNRWGTTIINELDSYIAAGSEVVVVADTDAAEAEIAGECGQLQHQAVSFQKGDTGDRRTLDDLNIPTFQQILVLSYMDTLGPQQADARTLITLLHLRDIGEHAGRPFTIVSEMLDVRNRQLAEVTRADDFIVSNRLVSLMLAQLAENGDLAAVFADLFDPAGAELYLKPACDYVETGRAVNFYTVVEAARRRGEVAIGYRVSAQASDPATTYGVRMNPVKSEAITFADQDRVIVLADSQ